MATAGRARASWWPLFIAFSLPRHNSPSVKEKEKHLEYSPIYCIIHAPLSHIRLYSPCARERWVLLEAWYAKFWIKMKMCTDIKTQTREGNYIARSKKWTLLQILHFMDTCSYSCFTRLTKISSATFSPGRFCRCQFYSVSKQCEMHHLDFKAQYVPCLQ